MTLAITIAAICSIALYIALFVLVGAWPLVVVGTFAVLAIAAAVGGLTYGGRP